MPQPQFLRALLTLGVWTLAMSSAPSSAGRAAPQAHVGDAEPAALGPLIMDRGADRQQIHFPRDEELVFVVALDFGVLGSPRVGKVTITSRVTPFFKDGLVGVEPDDRHLEQAMVSARAEGRYAVYTLDQLISTRFLPQAWPRLLHQNTQSGSENRRREQSIGVRDGASMASYRGDGHCKGCEDRAHFLKPTWVWQDEYHCDGCKRLEHRLWKEPKSKSIPAGTVDMVSGVMLARTVVEQGKGETTFPLLDRDKLWNVTVSLGKQARRTVRAGTFEVVEVVLVSRPPEGEPGREEDFEGLFGLHGSISIWMHPESGVPIEIAGTIPAGPIELDVSIQLESYRGTAGSFREVVRSKR